MQTNHFSLKVVAALLAVSAAIATLLPYMGARISAGSEWRGITPELSYDAMRYFASANDITRGHIFAHNPYFFEHRDETIPNPTFNDAIVALPQILGFSFNVGYYANIFFWALAFFFLLYAFFRSHALSPALGFFGALFVYAGLYGDMLRPGAMQIIYPLYIVFLLLFWRYVNRKDQSVIPLAMAAGLTAYFYIFLFMTVAATLGIYFLALCLSRNWAELRRILLMGIVAVAVALPHIAHVFFLASQDFYKETLARGNLFYSHWPQIEAYYYGRWVVIALLLGYLLRRYYPERVNSATHFFVAITGLGILLAMVSNIFTGQDFGIATHIGRFGIIWYLMVGVIILAPVCEFLFRARGLWQKRAFIGLLSVLLAYQMVANLNRSTFRFGEMWGKSAEVQTYGGVLDWLKRQPEGVVFAPEDLNSYIPMLTKQYLLYHPHGGMFLVNDDEFQERFLLYYAFDQLTLDEFVESTPLYGPAPSELAKTSVLRHRLCTLVHKEEDCPTPLPLRSFLDVAAMQKKYTDYYPNLVANIASEYAKYHVRYIVSVAGERHPLLGGPLCPMVYQDQWFEACQISI
ncbi:MAG: hypothetical protein Q7S52_02490 [bacterium]|nr:hypothetical protein [bacterium]